MIKLTKEISNMNNLILNTDSYKASHWLQYPPGTQYVSSYIESRGCDYNWDGTVFFGLQMFLKEYLSKPITKEMIDEADEFLTSHGEPFNRVGWEYILNKYNGYLPVKIQSVPEGMWIPTGNVLVQVVNTDSKVPWITSYLETSLLRAIWYPTTVATQDFEIKRIIKYYLDKTSEDTEGQIGFKLHDFGARGVSSMESAGIGGASHLVNFMGTDTITGALYVRKYYNETMPGFSIAAAEHSTITAWGGPDREIDAFENMLDRFIGEGKMVAVVSDSYDIYEACNKWYSLKDKIASSGGTLIIRPDSGHPPTVVSSVIENLMNLFGYTVNNKGYKVLPNYLRVIQGDGINHVSIKEILETMSHYKQSADNIAFGMGGAMLQQVNRDTMKFAMKASAIVRDNEWHDVYKKPVGDPSKNSKAGRLSLIERNKKILTVREDRIKFDENLLVEVFYNGEIIKEYNFSEIRERAAKRLFEK
jgi:nicotinamide phosphoribosyltransferase